MDYFIEYELLNYDKLKERLDKIENNQNNLFKVTKHEDIGKSSCGFSIPHYSIGSGKKHFIIFAGCHGNEIIGVDFVTELMHNLALGKGAFQNFKQDEYTIDFLPLINPEGFYTTTYGIDSITRNLKEKSLEEFCHDYFNAYKMDDKIYKNINDLIKDICKSLNILDNSNDVINNFWHYFKNYDYITDNNLFNFFKLYTSNLDKLRIVINELMLKYFKNNELNTLKKHQTMFKNVDLSCIPIKDESHQKLLDKLSNIYKDNLFPLSTICNFYANSNGVNLNDNNPYYYEIFKERLQKEKEIYAKGRENNILISVKSPIGMPNFSMDEPFIYENENKALFKFLKEKKDNNEYYMSFNCHASGGLLYAIPIINEEYGKNNLEVAKKYITKIEEVYNNLLHEKQTYNIMPKGSVITGVGDALREEYPYAFLLELSKMGGNPLGPYGDKDNNYIITIIANMEALFTLFN